MVRHIHARIDDDTHEQLSERKNDLGLTWEGLLKRGARDLDDTDPVTDSGPDPDPDHDAPVEKQLTDRQRELVEDNGGPDDA